MVFYEYMSASAQTAYASLAQAARQFDLSRSMADIPGSFNKKENPRSKKAYWYYQYKLPDGRNEQIYLGPDDASTQQLIEQRGQDTEAKRQPKQHLLQLMQAAAALGCVEVVPKHARVLHRLADHGLFKAGGVLVGTHAYLAYQNRLGVHWTGGDTTVDLDFAHPGKNISIALNANLKIDAHKAIDSLKMGFLPTNSGTRYYKSDEPDFDLDFLTCRTDESAAPIRIPQLNVSLQPLRFMEFSMGHPVIAVLPSGLGPIVVNIPAPERYALAKLLL